MCRIRGVGCIDLQGKLPRDATTFTDDAHFTEPGARRVAQAVAEHLLETEPLVSSRSREGEPSTVRLENPGGDR